MIYCANCDAEATVVVELDEPLYLCNTCGTAFQWGQVQPTVPVITLDMHFLLQAETGKEWK